MIFFFQQEIHGIWIAKELRLVDRYDAIFFSFVLI